MYIYGYLMIISAAGVGLKECPVWIALVLQWLCWAERMPSAVKMPKEMDRSALALQRCWAERMPLCIALGSSGGAGLKECPGLECSLLTSF